MSNVPVMPLGGGGDVFAELFKFWDDAVTPVQWEEVPAEVEMNSSGFPSERIIVQLDGSFFPDADSKKFVVLAFVGENAIYEKTPTSSNSRSSFFVAGAQVYWAYKSNGEISYIRTKPLMENSSTSENQGCAVCVEASAYPTISSKRSATGVTPRYNTTSHTLYLPFDSHTYTSTTGYRVEIPFLRVFLIRSKQ